MVSGNATAINLVQELIRSATQATRQSATQDAISAATPPVPAEPLSGVQTGMLGRHINTTA